MFCDTTEVCARMEEEDRIKSCLEAIEEDNENL
jgi:hypothetical protein